MVELNAEVLNEGEVGVGFGCFADAVMDVDGREADAESVHAGLHWHRGERAGELRSRLLRRRLRRCDRRGEYVRG